MDFFASLRYIERNQRLRAQQKQEGDSDINRLLSRYTFFWQKYDVLIQNCETKVYRGFSASLRYIERKSAVEGTTKPRERYRYLEGIPLTITVYLSDKKIRCRF